MNDRDPDSIERSTTAGNAENLSHLIELERAQIGADIHDRLLPLIFAASAATSSLLQDEHLRDDQRDRFQQVVDWLSEAMTVGRQMLGEMHPPELTHSSWKTAAIDLVNRLHPDSTTQIHWDVSNDLESLPSETATSLYRICVEAIRNALRHGQSRNVWVKGERDGNACRLEIRDDGDGFEPANVANDRFGIRSIQARAAFIGGRAEVRSQPGEETTVSVHWTR